VEKLSDIQRSVLLLRDYEGYSYEEIGQITGLNESQVKVYIFRARMFMKNYLVSLDRVI
jgi:RNA polymerase sigma-70 factor (ECF subfamily)